MSKQLELDLVRISYGFDPETVKPVMSVAEAMTLTVSRAVEEHGVSGARQRIPGLVWWGEERPS